MASKKLPLSFFISLAAIVIQSFIYYAWSIGGLKQSKQIHIGFNNSLPDFVQFTIETSQHWWLAPLLSVFTLYLALNVKAKPKLIYVPMLVSVGLALHMLYVTYPVLHLVKLS